MTTLLRIATAGSVDDGKSTLIGRLLYDSKAVMEDQLASVERTSKERGHDYTDLALVQIGGDRQDGFFEAAPDIMAALREIRSTAVASA